MTVEKSMKWPEVLNELAAQQHTLSFQAQREATTYRELADTQPISPFVAQSFNEVAEMLDNIGRLHLQVEEVIYGARTGLLRSTERKQQH